MGRGEVRGESEPPQGEKGRRAQGREVVCCAVPESEYSEEGRLYEGGQWPVQHVGTQAEM